MDFYQFRFRFLNHSLRLKLSLQVLQGEKTTPAAPQHQFRVSVPSGYIVDTTGQQGLSYRQDILRNDDTVVSDYSFSLTFDPKLCTNFIHLLFFLSQNDRFSIREYANSRCSRSCRIKIRIDAVVSSILPESRQSEIGRSEKRSRSNYEHGSSEEGIFFTRRECFFHQFGSQNQPELI